MLAESVIEDEDESTRAGGGGQLPKFGAMEEKIGRRFFGMGNDEKNYRGRLIPPDGVRFSGGFTRGEEIGCSGSI